MTIEPKPAGPTFARCALRGAHAGPNGLPMDTNIYIYIYQRIAPANSYMRLASLAINIYTRNLKFAQLVTELASLARTRKRYRVGLADSAACGIVAR